MRYGKRFICVLLTAAFLMLCPLPSLAETAPTASFQEPAYIFRYGADAKVIATVRSESEHEWILKTAEGVELGRSRVRGKDGSVSFRFTVARDLPKHSVLQLFCDDGDFVLCEAQLFCDVKQNYGIRQVATDRRVLAITFDAANASSHTLEILDLLEQYDAKATFFVIGRYAENNPEVSREIIARGHEIASHSYEHLNMKVSTDKQIFMSLSKTDRLLREVNGNTTVQYRPPSGVSVFADRAVAHGFGAEVILWSIDSGDGFSYVSEDGVIHRVKGSLHNGGIVLMHVYGQFTLNALRVLLPYYAEQGYSFVTVSDLLLKGETYIDAFGTQRPLHHDDASVAPIADQLSDRR